MAIQWESCMNMQVEAEIEVIKFMQQKNLSHSYWDELDKIGTFCCIGDLSTPKKYETKYYQWKVIIDKKRKKR